jgi:regulator of protease activity HflC (stomatin/prohibitin superfamily)
VTEPYTPPPEPTGYEQEAPVVTSPSYVQLTQQRVRLGRAAEAFATPDEVGRYPIVVLVKSGGRFQVQVLLVAGAVALAAVLLPVGPVLTIAGLVAAVALVIGGSARAVLLPVPEGTQAILVQAGRYFKTAGAGVQSVPPTVIVSHLVTTREIPFSALAREVPAADDVRVDVEILLTFRIVEPRKFVFNTTAPDFDAVCQGAGQSAVRRLLRGIGSEAVLDLALRDSDDLRAMISATLEPYGVEVTRVLVVRLDAPPEFLVTREGRRLAMLQTGEQAERATYDLAVQANRDAVARAELQARFARATEETRLAAEVERLQVELESEREALRLARLEERLAASPNAARWDWETQRLRVARALARNSRAMLQLGGSGDIADALVTRAFLERDDAAAAGEAPAGGETPPSARGEPT